MTDDLVLMDLLTASMASSRLRSRDSSFALVNSDTDMSLDSRTSSAVMIPSVLDSAILADLSNSSTARRASPISDAMSAMSERASSSAPSWTMASSALALTMASSPSLS